jgi:hypothetical protein
LPLGRRCATEQFGVALRITFVRTATRLPLARKAAAISVLTRQQRRIPTVKRIEQALGWCWGYLNSRVQSYVMTVNSCLNRIQDVTWLVGDGRSGTTWATGLINWDRRCCEMNEPFHPRCVKAMKNLRLHEYIRPEDSGHELLPVASKVFSGRLRHPRVTWNNHALTYRSLVIKDVFVNLLACWAARHFPDLKIVLLIRNPFAVALSKWKTRHWRWMTDPKEFLDQKALLEDYLRPFEDLIATERDDFIERQVLIWAIIHYVPLLQFKPGQIHIAFYENLIEHPEQELARLFGYLTPESADRMTAGALQIRTRPSSMALDRGKLNRDQWPIGQWKEALSAEQISRGMRILARFGLDRLYDDARPREDPFPGASPTGFLTQG